MTAVLPPLAADLDGARWTVHRAWAAERGSMPVELRRDGRVRGGYWDGVRFTVLPPDADGRLPALGEACRRGGAPGVVVSHRPGRRAVVRGGDGAYRKVVRPGRAASVLAGVSRAAAFDGPFRMPAVLDHNDAVVAFAALPGRSLHEGEGWSLAEWDRAWGEVLAAWAEAVARGVRIDGWPVHDAESEARVLSEWVDRAAPYGAPAPGWREACERTITRLLRLGPSPAGARPIHRDLHDKQLLWDAVAGPGLLDVDTACAGEPAIDLGNLRAHARWRHLQGLWTAEQTTRVTGHIDAVSLGAGCAPERVLVFQDAALLRLSCVYAMRPRWRPRVPALLPAGTIVTGSA
ncbi:MAG: phosphotransferase [Propioniciclava sp.]|uniref:hypothetical protein n=1 Tax=Propioniciclava sp. TaxID=2038686 RepID=UPI0039E6F386